MKPTTQKFFKEMAEIAMDHWDFEGASEPYASSKSGLQNLIDAPLTDEQLLEIEASHGPLVDANGNFDWGWLSELAVGSSQ